MINFWPTLIVGLSVVRTTDPSSLKTILLPPATETATPAEGGLLGGVKLPVNMDVGIGSDGN